MEWYQCGWSGMWDNTQVEEQRRRRRAPPADNGWLRLLAHGPAAAGSIRCCFYFSASARWVVAALRKKRLDAAERLVRHEADEGSGAGGQAGPKPPFGRSLIPDHRI
ncbi:hypothetical protein S40293_10611 [Stachybotrys chartarum IBT 40293]|nr:hypothetical protein S40293_10611 [Stachybotrys chartarum IBT 40293]KFA79109.1 hypothetical protein S40288_11211 [Stachybotrys chartarum IBT 40288]